VAHGGDFARWSGYSWLALLGEQAVAHGVGIGWLLVVGVEGWERSVDLDVGVAQAGPIAGAGPEPVVRLLDQTPSDWVVMDVFDGVVNGGRVVEVLVPPGAWLPEAMICTVGVGDGQSLKEPRCVLFEILHRFVADRPLDCRQDFVRPHLGVRGPE